MTTVSDEIIKLLREKSRAILPEAIKIRRHIHMYPELSFREFNTASYIAAYLDRLDIPYKGGIAETGIIATLRGNLGVGPVIGLRAELDALPIEEKNDCDYQSRNKGLMHACGHDAHMAMLLASASVLSQMTSCFRGEIIFIFQPGEELVPGGASLLMKEGTLSGLKPAAVIAQHLLPELDSGKIGFRAGKYMASSDEIYIDLRGRGGHAALPGLSTDQVLIASELVCLLKEKVKNQGDEFPLVLGIGKFIADGATNVIPETVHIEGTLRTFDEKVRSAAHKTILDACKTVASNHNIGIFAEIRQGYPVLSNDESLTRKALVLATRIHNNDNVVELPIRMSSEDFAFYAAEFPILFYRLGARPDGAEPKYLHTPLFDMDEAAMENGILTLCAIAIELANDLK